jgi:hypothetical protein
VNRESNSLLRFLKWLAITVACALPLHVAIMGEAAPQELAGEVLALATWATGMAFLEAFVAQRWPVTKGRSLTIGFTAWAVVQGVLAVFAFRDRVEGWITPYFFSAMPGMLLLNGFDGSDLRGSGFVVYALTVSCGLFNLAAGLFATACVALLTRPSRSPPPDTAPSPALPPTPLRE